MHNKVFCMNRSLLFTFLLLFFSVALSTDINAQNTPINNTSSYQSVDIKVFPNPAIDYFQISNAQNISKAIVYNMFGKEVKVFNYITTSSQNNISDLRTGMYIIKMLDDKNKVIKSVKLQKTDSGI